MPGRSSRSHSHSRPSSDKSKVETKAVGKFASAPDPESWIRSATEHFLLVLGGMQKQCPRCQTRHPNHTSMHREQLHFLSPQRSVPPQYAWNYGQELSALSSVAAPASMSKETGTT